MGLHQPDISGTCPKSEASMTRMRLWLKLGTFGIGLGLLLYEAWFLDYPDWVVGISLVMAFVNLATAERSASVFWERRWRWLPLAVFWTWLSVDGVYWTYWSFVRPEVMIRVGQWLAFLCIYALCGVIWYRFAPEIASIVYRRLHMFEAE